MTLIIHTDGGARGNPGPAAVGVVIEECQCVDVSECQEKHKKTVAEFGKYIGETTNNVAEYTGVVEALKFLTQRQGDERTEIIFFLDSTLVVNQLNGLFKIKDARLRELLARVRVLEQETRADIRYCIIPREQNSRADFFVNKALDEQLR